MFKKLIPVLVLVLTACSNMQTTTPAAMATSPCCEKCECCKDKQCSCCKNGGCKECCGSGMCTMCQHGKTADGKQPSMCVKGKKAKTAHHE